MKTQQLKTLIKHDLDRKKHLLTQPEIDTWNLIIKEVKKDLINQMDFLHGSPFVKSLIKRTVFLIQKECITLLNAAAKLKEVLPEAIELKETVIACLESLMDEIERRHFMYAEDDILMPDISLDKTVIKVLEQAELIGAKFKEHPIDADLCHIILSCMRDISYLKKCTYRKMNYIKKLQEEISALLERKGLDTDSLKQLLIKLNFNERNFIGYCKQWIREELEQFDDVRSKVGTLHRYQFRFKLPPFQKIKLRYDFKKDGITAQLLQFVNQEYLEMTNASPVISRAEQPESNIGKDEVMAKNKAGFPAGYKIQSEISVEAIAYLFRLLVDVEAINQGVKTEFTSFLANIFSSPQTKNGCSATSFYVKYRTPTQAARRTLKLLLTRMLKSIENQ